MRQFLIFFVTVTIQDSPPYREAYLEDLCDPKLGNYASVGLENAGRSSAVVLKGRRYNSSKTSISCRFKIETKGVNIFTLMIRYIDFNDDTDSRCINNSLTIIPFDQKKSLDDNDSMLIYCSESQLENRDSMTFSYPMTVKAIVEFEASNENSSIIELLFLAFKEGPCSGDFGFPCKNGMCISGSLVCDKYDHCGDESDETGFGPSCYYIPKLCGENGIASYELGIHSPMMMVKAGGQNLNYTHEICVYEITETNVSNPVIILNITKMNFDEAKQHCNVMIQVYDKGSRVKTFCNANMSSGYASIGLETSNSILVYTHLKLHKNVNYEMRFLVAAVGNGTCGQEFDFPCGNGICISSTLLCDGYQDCEYGYDESNYLFDCHPWNPIIYISIMISIWTVWYIRRKKLERKAQDTPTSEEDNINGNNDNKQEGLNDSTSVASDITASDVSPLKKFTSSPKSLPDVEEISS